MPAFSVLMKPASSLCNMSCEYCFYKDEATKRDMACYGMMDEKTLKNVIRKTLLNAQGSITYGFQGGEPTLCGISFFEKAVEYEKQYNHHRLPIRNAFQTNGYGIDEAWCEFLAKNQFLVGVSIDGTRTIHDKYRHSAAGEASYDRIRHATQLMDDYGVEYNILTVVHREIAENIQQIYKEYKANGWLYMQFIPCLDPLDEQRGKSEYALTPKLYGRFLVELFDLWYQDVSQGNPVYIRQFENYMGILGGYPPEACDQRGCCSVQVVVEGDGSVYPCDFYVQDAYRMGNLNTDKFMDIYQHPNGGINVNRSKSLDPKCRPCPWYALCRGGCFRHRDFIPDTNSYENYFCESYQYFFDKCYERMNKLAALLIK